MNYIRFVSLAAALLLVLSARARAEQGCPPGFTLNASGAPGGAMCVPIPNYQPGSTGPAEAEPRWFSRWGAIVIASKGTTTTSVLGVSKHMVSEEQAREVAMQDCLAQGGIGCKLNLVYSDQCGVVVWGDTVAVSGHAQTIDKAEALAMADCNAKSTNCSLYYYDCSYPAKIQ